MTPTICILKNQDFSFSGVSYYFDIYMFNMSKEKYNDKNMTLKRGYENTSNHNNKKLHLNDLNKPEIRQLSSIIKKVYKTEHHENDQESNRKNSKEVVSPSCEWSEHFSRTGRKYYYNIKSEVSQWEKPQILVERETYYKIRSNKLSNKQHKVKENVKSNYSISDINTVNRDFQNIKGSIASNQSNQAYKTLGLCDYNKTILNVSESSKKLSEKVSFNETTENIHSFLPQSSCKINETSSPLKNGPSFSPSGEKYNLQKALNNLHQAIMLSHKSSNAHKNFDQNLGAPVLKNASALPLDSPNGVSEISSKTTPSCSSLQNQLLVDEDDDDMEKLHYNSSTTYINNIIPEVRNNVDLFVQSKDKVELLSQSSLSPVSSMEEPDNSYQVSAKADDIESLSPSSSILDNNVQEDYQNNDKLIERNLNISTLTNKNGIPINTTYDLNHYKNSFNLSNINLIDYVFPLPVALTISNLYKSTEKNNSSFLQPCVKDSPGTGFFNASTIYQPCTSATIMLDNNCNRDLSEQNKEISESDEYIKGLLFLLGNNCTTNYQPNQQSLISKDSLVSAASHISSLITNYCSNTQISSGAILNNLYATTTITTEDKRFLKEFYQSEPYQCELKAFSSYSDFSDIIHLSLPKIDSQLFHLSLNVSNLTSQLLIMDMKILSLKSNFQIINGLKIERK